MAKRQSQAAQDLFASLPLSPSLKSTRVLDLFEATDPSDEKELRGLLRVVNLTEHPSYIALSYVWGTFASPGHEDTISCGTSSIKITSNCWSALWHIRKVLGSVTIWVDSICINQEDEHERTSQVPLMGDIYTRANSTYVWLGEGNLHSDAAIRYLKVAGFQEYLQEDGFCNYKIPTGFLLRFQIAFRMFIKGYKTVIIQLSKRSLSDQLRVAFCAAHKGVDPGALEDFFSRDWITRVWTLQEVMLSERLVILCGLETLSWRSLIYSMAFLDHTTDTRGLEGLQVTSYDWRRIVTLWLSRKAPESVPAVAPDSSMRHHLGQYWGLLHSVSLLCITLCRAVIAAFISAVLEVLIAVLICTFKFSPVPSSTSAICILVVIGTIALAFFCTNYYFRQSFWSRNLREDTEINFRTAMVQEIRKRKSTEPKDKSFGMHTVLGRLGLPLALPDYSRDVKEVYRELLISLLQWTSSLAPLLCVRYKENSTSPSWLPDWHSDSVPIWAEERIFRRPSGISTPTSSELLWRILSPSEIAVRGVCASRITWVGGLFSKTGDNYDPSDDAAHVQNISRIQACLNALPKEHRIHKKRRRDSRMKVPETILMQNHRLIFSDSSETFQLIHRWLTAIAPAESSTPEQTLEKLKADSQLLSVHIKICNNLEAKRRKFLLQRINIWQMVRSMLKSETSWPISLVSQCH